MNVNPYVCICARLSRSLPTILGGFFARSGHFGDKQNWLGLPKLDIERIGNPVNFDANQVSRLGHRHRELEPRRVPQHPARRQRAQAQTRASTGASPAI